MKSNAISLIFFLLVSSLFSQNLILDINQNGREAHSWPRGFKILNNGFVFQAQTLENGGELWWSDGTPNGTRLVKDIWPGRFGGVNYPSVEIGVTLGDTLIFKANDGENGTQLWRTDATASGTYRISSFDRLISNPIVFNQEIYFTLLREKSTYIELWKGTGQAESFQLVKDSIATAILSSDMFSIGGLLYFTSATHNGQIWIWRSDGTDQGTFPILKDVVGINAGCLDCKVPHAEFQNKLYFSVQKSGVVSIYESDGTPAGTKIVKDNFLGTFTQSLEGNAAVANGHIYFSYSKLRSPYAFTMVKSDGTPGGTSVKTTISNQFYFGYSVPYVSGDWLYFTAPDSSGTGLLRYHTLSENVETIEHIDVLDNMTFQRFPIIFNENSMGLISIFLPSRNVVGGNFFQRLLFTDGSATGTFAATPGFAQSPPVVKGSTFYYGVSLGPGDYEEIELFQSDGTIAGTSLLQNIEQENSSFVHPNYHLTFDNKVYTYLDDGVHEREIWVTDGTTLGTHLLKDIHPNGNTQLTEIIPLNGKFFFSAFDSSRQEPWLSNGTSSGTQLLSDLSYSFGSITISSSSPDNFTPFGNYVYFSAFGGRDLWRTDGTSMGTERVITPGSSTSTPYLIRDLEVVNGELVFSTYVNDALWKTNGNLGDSTLIMDNLGIQRLYTGSSFKSLYSSGNLVYFVVLDPSNGTEVWRSDGTPNGTFLLKDVFPGSKENYDLSSKPVGLSPADSLLFFFQDDGVHGRELWKTDGTTVGTQLVKDIYEGKSSGVWDVALHEPVSMNGLLYFVGRDSIHGMELWKSDGTAAGTVLVKDIRSGPKSSMPQDLWVADKLLFFAAYDENNGVELWQSDGTPNGTIRLTDINSGLANSNPYAIGKLGNTLIFSALDGVHGRELWSLQLSATDVAPSQLNTKLHLFPNPASNALSIRWEGSPIGKTNLRIFTLDGKVVLNKIISNAQSTFQHSISTDNLPEGMYLLELRSNGKKVIKPFVR